jgi:soluble lytic murein transglycosylase-like protein
MSISAALIDTQPAAVPATRQKYDKNSILPERSFAAQLDQAISTEPTTKFAAKNARELAESLTLQMMHASLTLGGGSPSATSAPITTGQPFSSAHSLLQAYHANLAPSGQPSQTSPTALPTSSTAASEVTISTSVETATSASPVAQRRGRDWLDPIIAKAAGRYGVDGDLIRAVIKTESNFNPQAVSPAGAHGLMQLMPATARGLGVSDSFDPEQNVMAGTRFLSDLLQRYNGNLDSALAAYNWGPGNVDRRPEQMPRETRDYLVRVKQSYATYSV